MKLSIIVGIYKRKNELNNFFESFEKQTSNNYELIIIIDTLQDHILEVASLWKEKLGTRLKIIFNSKRQGRFKALRDGLKIASGSYSMFISTSDIFKENMVEKTLETIRKNGADILEFLPKFKGKLKWEPKFRHNISKMVVIKDKPIILAKTFPIDFNKVFKTKIAIDAISGRVFQEINSRFSQEFLFILLANCKTYVAIKETFLISHITDKSSFNPFSILRLWKSISEYYIINDLNNQVEIFYNGVYHTKIFLMKFVVASKNKVMFNKYHTKLTNLLDKKFKARFLANKYLNQENEEAQYLVKSKTKTEVLKINKELK